ncbi:MAG: hypothetical protein J6386_06050 [Candidatus Synoicihabitans palmerolidicus]|nr:hypothetical protein [Candidatus Synoicihabitans palmerolidicus]
MFDNLAQVIAHRMPGSQVVPLVQLRVEPLLLGRSGHAHLHVAIPALLLRVSVRLSVSVSPLDFIPLKQIENRPNGIAQSYTADLQLLHPSREKTMGLQVGG